MYDDFGQTYEVTDHAVKVIKSGYIIYFTSEEGARSFVLTYSGCYLI